MTTPPRASKSEPDLNGSSSNSSRLGAFSMVMSCIGLLIGVTAYVVSQSNVPYLSGLISYGLGVVVVGVNLTAIISGIVAISDNLGRNCAIAAIVIALVPIAFFVINVM
jgi:hypothetical protein